MSDFLDLIESFSAEQASTAALFGGEGTRMGANRNNPRYGEYLAEAAEFVGDVLDGRRPMHQLREALTTDDFPLLFGDILSRQLVAAYREWPAVYQNWVKTSTVPDFRQVSRFAVDGAEGQLEAVAEQAPYPAKSLSEARDQFSVSKYGGRLPLSWETLVNDDLDAFRTAPQRLGRGARRTEQKFATQLYVDSTGPHASLYDATNTVTGNPALSITALQTAFTLLAAQTDEDGEPILIETVELVVPPALEITARNILNAIHIEVAAGSGATETLRAANWMTNRVRLNVDPYIPIVASSSNGNTSWFLFANPNTGRAAVEMGFLRGHTDPALFMKRPDAQLIGGTPGPEGAEVDFDTDTRQYKVRHVFGGTRLTSTGGKKATVASEGDGS